MTKQDVHAKKLEIVTNLIHEYHVPLSLYQQQLNEDCARRILAELEAVDKEAKAWGLVNQWIDEGRKNNNE